MTTINLSGLPNNVTIQQINKMFNGFGKCLKISIYEYQQLDQTFINAVVKLDLLSLNNDYKDVKIDVLKATDTQHSLQSDEMLNDTQCDVNDDELQEDTLINKEHNGDKLDKGSIGAPTKRRNRQKTVIPNLKEYSDVLSVNLDDMLSK